MKTLKDINWNHLYCFYEVAKAQSLKKGAQTLNVASSTVSAQLKTLEKNFDSKLFIRSSKGLGLSVEGADLFERVKLIFEEGSKLLEHFSDDEVGGYPVSIGIEDSVFHDLSEEFASQYWDTYTEFGTVNTVKQSDHESLIANISQGNIDWGITVRKPTRKNLEYREIGVFEIVFCCSQKLYDKFKNKQDLLSNIPFAESIWDKALNTRVYKHLRRNGIVPREKIYSDHLGFVQKLCSRGRCVMYLPRNPLKKYPNLRTFQLDEPLKVSLYAVWRKADNELLSIKKLVELISSNISIVPERYKDIDFQIEVSEVADDLLK
tara:strand:+ start:237840 stop:238799 length:960 start_codon:yes stop_codon:yes gene_type:complete